MIQKLIYLERRNSLSLLVVVSFLAVFATAGFAFDHTAVIEVTVNRGAVGCHFSAYEGHGRVTVNGVPVENPYTSRFTKLASRDDSSTPPRVTPNNPWRVTVEFSGPGTFIFDISDWESGSDATVNLRIDGVVFFAGHGSTPTYAGWMKNFGPGVRQTDDREIAFALP